MRLLETLVVLALSHYGLCHSTSDPYLEARELRSRNIVTDGSIADSYDFIIVGGGLAGLAVASRLSEDSNTTVLVLEAGDTGDAVASAIDVPGNTYYTSLANSAYDWQYKTVAQANAGDRSIPWARGRVLGGSSAINGMYLVRPAADEANVWANLIASDDSTAAANWEWESLSAAMRKSETFTAPSSTIQEEAAILYNASTFGSSGPLHCSYPGYTFPIVGNWTNTLAELGVPASADAYSGVTSGGFISTSYINPNNWTRSYSRAAYIDPLPPRPNLSILPNATVTRIIFASNSTAGNLTANSVEYAAYEGAKTVTVNVTKEVILSGGVVGTPQVLMLSGVGPEDVLEAAGVTVLNALPGVGQHLQDHLSTGVVFSSTEATAGSVYASGDAESKTAEFLSFINSATAYINASQLLGSDGASTYASNLSSAFLTSTSTLVPSQYSEVQQGYEAIYNATSSFVQGSVAQVEILLSINAASQVAIQAAIQHPLSQGRLYINSSSAFDHPVIDPNYFSHSADVAILREGLKFARQLGNTAPLSNHLGSEITPGSSVNTDDEWDAWLVTQAGTEYHPGGTSAMLPKSQGGVVNAKLQVYGLANVRVVDASVYPISFAAHFMAATYGLAEKASELIRAEYNGLATSTTSSSSSSSSTSTTAASGTSSKHNRAIRAADIFARGSGTWVILCTAVAAISGLCLF